MKNCFWYKRTGSSIRQYRACKHEWKMDFATQSVLAGNRRERARRRGSDRSGDGKATKQTFMALSGTQLHENEFRILA